MAISVDILIMEAGGNKPARRLPRLFVYVCRLQRLLDVQGGVADDGAAGARVDFA